MNVVVMAAADPADPAGVLFTRYFNVTSGFFALRYVLGGGDPRAPTEIFAWPERYAEWPSRRLLRTRGGKAPCAWSKAAAGC